MNRIPNHLKPVYVRAKRRGMKELDIILGYVAEFLPNMSNQQIENFKVLLSQDDANLFKWIMKKEKIPDHLNNDIWEIILSFKPDNIESMN